MPRSEVVKVFNNVGKREQTTRKTHNGLRTVEGYVCPPRQIKKSFYNLTPGEFVAAQETSRTRLIKARNNIHHWTRQAQLEEQILNFIQTSFKEIEDETTNAI